MRLAAAEVLMRIKFSLPDDTVSLRWARVLADSVLMEASGQPAAEAGWLAPVAAVMGRCRLASALRAREQAMSAAGPARELHADIRAAEAHLVLGCRPPEGLELAALVGRAEAVSDAQLRRLLFGSMARAALMEPPEDSSAVMRLEREGAWMSVWPAVYRGQNAVAREALRGIHRDSLTVVTPDATFMEARAWLASGDSAAAIALLDTQLQRTRELPPGSLGFVEAAGLMRAASLRAELGNAVGDHASALRWTVPVRILWSGADPELRSRVRNTAGRVETHISSR